MQELGGRLDEGHDFRFDFNKPRPAVVCFARDPSQIEDPARTTTVCTATCEAEIPILVAEKLAAPLKDEVAALGSLGSSELGAIDEIFSDLSSLLKSTIDVFRWRHGLVGGLVGGPEASYSEDGKCWLKASLVRGVVIRTGIPFKSSLKDVPPEEIVRLVEEGKGEPVAHQLFREAWALKDSKSFKRTRHWHGCSRGWRERIDRRTCARRAVARERNSISITHENTSRVHTELAGSYAF